MKKLVSIISILAIMLVSITSVFANPVVDSKGVIIAPGVDMGEYGNQGVEINYNEVSKMVTNYVANSQMQVEPVNRTSIEYGVPRLCLMIGSKHNENTSFTDVKKISDNHYVITVASALPWALGNWNVVIVPDTTENRVAPKGGYWYGYYNEKGQRTGICLASKIK